MNQIQQEEESTRQRTWVYLQHADNLHAGRVNFFLVAESMLAVSFVTALLSNEAIFLLITIASLGLVYTVSWLYVNKRLDKRKSLLHRDLMTLDQIYKKYMEEVGGVSASKALSLLLPLTTVIFWVLLLLWAIITQR